LFDIEMKREEAQAALTRAVAEGTTNAYAYYRLASLRWQPKPDPALLVELDKLLAKAVQLNSRYPRAYALLAEVRSLQGQSESALGLVLRAVQLDVTDSNTRLTAARVLLRAKQTEQAHKAARAALSLAATEDEPRRAKELLEAIERAR
jgi:tetratricopeptide (TPR) repeat protein